MNDIEELKRKRMLEMQERMLFQSQEEQQLKQQIEQLEAIVKSRMTKEAAERYGNVKIAFPEKAVQALVVLAQLIQTGQIDQIDDDHLKDIFKKLTPEKKEFKIKRK